MLPTVEAVVAAIGRERVMALTGRGSNFLWNWQDTGFFPPTTYVVLNTELARLGYSAPPQLWKMIVAAKRKRAA